MSGHALHAALSKALKVLACPKVSPWSHVKTEHPLDIFIRMGTCQSYGNSAHRCWTEVVLNSKFMNTGTRTGFFFFFFFSAFQRLSWFWTTSFDHMLHHVILRKPSLCNVSPHSCLHLRCIQDTGADNQRARALEHRALELETKVNVIACIMHRTRAGNQRARHRLHRAHHTQAGDQRERHRLHCGYSDIGARNQRARHRLHRAHDTGAGNAYISPRASYRGHWPRIFVPTTPAQPTTIL